MTVTGLDSLRQALEAAPAVANARAAKAVSVSTVATSRRVQSLAPRDTGLLSRSISAAAQKLSGRVLIAPEAFYWRFVEYGSSHRISALGGRTVTAARPFVRTATEVETPDFIRRMEDVAESIARDLSTSRFL